MFDETIDLQQLLDNLSVQVEHIKTQADRIESTVRSSVNEPVAITTITNRLGDAVSYINQSIISKYPVFSRSQ